ncbi:tyrosine-type recombinase/integrase [Burkholderia cenocepacia]|uniref:tyrosine-type recombinase/integrase n=1 Tax=Burkholderia cenocepacia TaxID=95486 RepID=UPI001BA38947|nr:tyrosine-type recombinase/integrase [Burkholderia cenocepacia]MBR8137218.1 tyrosine-type recombinase/integrase [Burkholderia cenocepacia]
MQRYFTETETTVLLKTVGTVNSLPARRDDAAIRALLCSGLRIGEFLKVTLGAALRALDSKYLFIPREDRKKKTVVTEAGTRVIADDHKVFVTAPLRKALEDLIRIHGEMVERARFDADELALNTPLMLSREGVASRAGMTPRTFQIRFKQWCERAGLTPDATPHWLRHTRAMQIMRESQATDPRGIVQSVLGHRSIQSTAVYTGVSREEVEAALDRVDAPRAGRRMSLTELRHTYLADRAIGGGAA